MFNTDWDLMWVSLVLVGLLFGFLWARGDGKGRVLENIGEASVSLCIP